MNWLHLKFVFLDGVLDHSDGWKKQIPTCVRLTSDFCDDDINRRTYLSQFCGKPFGCVWDLTKEKHEEENRKLINEGKEDETTQPDNSRSSLFTCVENELAQDNEVTSFNFANDWVKWLFFCAPLLV